MLDHSDSHVSNRHLAASVYTNGSSSYAPIQGTDQFEQPALASSLLQKIKNVNDHILKEVCFVYIVEL